MNDAVSAPALEISRSHGVKFDWKEFAAGITETAANLVLKGWADAGTSAFVSFAKSLSSLGIDTPREAKAWALCAFSFAWSLDQVKNEGDSHVEILRTVLKDVIKRIEGDVDARTYSINNTFFERPTTANIYRDMRDATIARKTEFLINPNTPDSVLSAKMDIAFNRAVFEIWSKKPDDYKEIKEFFAAPGMDVIEHDLSWTTYRSQLIHSFEVKPTFGQEVTGISLGQLYVPLRAYWVPERDNEDRDIYFNYVPVTAHILRIDDELDAWVETPSSSGRIKLIGGGPGSGKSTTLKAFARRLASKMNIRPIFIPLQHIEFNGDLKESINRYFTDKINGPFVHPPLHRPYVEDGAPLVLIFDGLDELVAPNEAANEVIATFAAKVNNLVTSLRGDGEYNIRVIISGRMPAFQAAKRYLEIAPDSCLEVLGYNVIDDSNRINKSDLWAKDQRQDWWNQYATARNIETTMPDALLSEDLESISQEPLLCYLLVLSGFATDNWEQAAENPNRIYSALMNDIYKRGWGDGHIKRHGPGRTMSNGDFLKLMRTIGLAAWLGGDTRVASDSAFHAALKITNAQRAWEDFEADNGPDVTNLAMNFYLKSAEGSQRGFEFTHKSFGEYLVALALIEVALASYDLVNRRVDFAMLEWANATSTGRITPEILEFMRNEIRLRLDDSGEAYEKILDLKKGFSKIADFAALEGFPLESGGNWRDADRSQNNSELAAWAILNSCMLALRSDSRSTEMLKLDSIRGFGLRELLYRQAKQSGVTPITLQCLAYIDTRSTYLFGSYGTGIDLSGAVLDNILVEGCYFSMGSFFGAFLENGSFGHSTFDNIDFRQCNFQNFHFNECRFDNCQFDGAIFNNVRIDPQTIVMSEPGIFDEYSNGLVMYGKPDAVNIDTLYLSMKKTTALIPSGGHY